jgi:hypothetical protein
MVETLMVHQKPAKFEINGGTQLSDNTEMYYNAAYIFKKSKLFCKLQSTLLRKAADSIFTSCLVMERQLHMLDMFQHLLRLK